MVTWFLQRDMLGKEGKERVRSLTSSLPHLNYCKHWALQRLGKEGKQNI